MKDINQTEELFDGLFKESLENASAQVPPGVWEAVSGAVGQGAAIAGAAAKTALWMKAAIAALAVAGASYISYTLYSSGQDNQAQTTQPVQTPVQENSTQAESAPDLNQAITAVQEPASKPANQHNDRSAKPVKERTNENPDPNSVLPNPIYSIDANLEYTPGPQTGETKTAESTKTEKPAAEKPQSNLPEPSLEKNHSSYTYVNDSSFIFIPNVVTPDGDGINDTYMIKLVGEETFEIIIYTIDNQILYRSKNKYQAWNCKLPNGEDAPAGSYVVKVIYKFKGKDQQTDYQKLTLIK